MRLIDADALKQLITKRNHIWDIVTDSCGRGLTEIIDSLPAIDAVEVVRCRYCENRRYSEFNDAYFCDILGVIVEDDFFCKDGEKKQ